ncbi:MAG: hypothetical protein Q8Q38_02790 [bacterium]|nr:hypothetical protein [bacterium]
MTGAYTTIILPGKPQADTIVALFLLRSFGKERYPGVEQAKIEAMSLIEKDQKDKEDVLLIDIGGGAFDHHGTQKTVSQLVAEDLRIKDDPALQRLLEYVERDERYGAGTISKDPIDRAFGLSGLISSLTRSMPENTQGVVTAVLPLLEAHYTEQKKWFEELPQEFIEKERNGKAETLEMKHKGKKIRVICIEADGQSMASYLRSQAGQKADVVAQRLSSGHVNIVTLQQKKIDLRMTAGLLRIEEADKKGRRLLVGPADLVEPGRIEDVPEWYYDTATNSLLNGGLHPKGTDPTRIPFVRIKEILREGLESQVKA